MQSLKTKLPDFFFHVEPIDETILEENQLKDIELGEGLVLVEEINFNDYKAFKHFEIKNDDIKVGRILKIGLSPIERSYFKIVRPEVGRWIAYTIFAGDTIEILNKTYKIIQDREMALFLRSPDVFVKKSKD